MIVDLYGNPIEPAKLAEPQTGSAQTVHLKREFANHPSRGLTPQKLARILEDAEQYNLIDQANLWLDMSEKWGHMSAEMGRRQRALLTLERRFVPPDKPSAAEQKATDFLNDIFDSFFATPNPFDEEAQDAPTVDNVILGCADAIGQGYSAQEIRWQREGKMWTPAEITLQPASWFTTDQATHRKLRLRSTGADGERLQPGSWILHKHRSMMGYPARQGLVRSLAWPYIFSNYAIRDLAELLEIFGQPIIIGKHPGQATPTEKRTLLRAVTEIGHRAGGIVPDSMTLDVLLQGAGSSGDIFRQMIDWAEATASKLITGQHYDGGRTATESNERVEVKADLTTTDARQIDQTLTAFGWLILTLNPEGVGIAPRRSPRHKFDTAEIEDIEKLSKSLPPLVAVGGQFSKKWLNEKTKIPAPENPEDTLAPLPPASVPAVDTTSQNAVNTPAAASVAALAADKSANGEPIYNPSPAMIYAETLAANAQGPLAEWLTVIQSSLDDAIAAGKSLEDWREEIGTMYPALKSGPMADVFGEALLAASLAGRLDVKRGS